MKRLVLSLMVLSLLGLGGQTFAELCTIDDVPAATLLLPYFEVDLDQDNGVTTLFSVNNASAAPALVHAVMWTDWSHPTIDFDFYLTGYDVQTVNLRDVFDGNLPVTADDQSDPSDTVSPAGRLFDNPTPEIQGYSENSHWDGDFTGNGNYCNAIFPFSNPVVEGCAFDRLVNGHTGNAVACEGGACLGSSFGDNVARGYITFDNANFCSLEFPDAAGYFIQGGGGVANNINQLWGDYFIVDPGNGFANGDNLVHVEADSSLAFDINDPDGANEATEYTFYGRYVAEGADNREPLSTSHGVRYLNGGAFTGGTDLIVWRDSTDPTGENDPAGYTCGVGPAWYPLNETEVVAFDEQEDAVQICVPFEDQPPVSPPEDPDEDPGCFPLETGRYAFGEGDLDVPYDFGWVFLNLNHDYVNGQVGEVDGIAQSYVSAIHSATGLYSVGLAAIELTDACTNDDPALPTIVDGPNNVIPQF